MAVFIGGLILLGYEAGPQMITNDLPVTYTIVWSLALANVLGAGLCIGLSGPIARLTTIRFTLLAPFLFMLIAFAAFQSRQSLGDLVALVAIGLLGVFMKRFDWSRPAFLIGFVLSSQAEVYTYQAAQIASIKLRTSSFEMLAYIFSPISIAILAITVLSVWFGARQAKSIIPENATQNPRRAAPIIFALFVTAFLAVALIDALTIPVFNDKVFPAAVAAISLMAAVLLLVQMIRAPAGHPLFADSETTAEDASAPHGIWQTLAWFISLLVLTALVGFAIALAAFFIAFLSIRARCSWQRTIALTIAGVSFIIGMAGLLNRDLPPGLLQQFVELPWPLR